MDGNTPPSEEKFVLGIHSGNLFLFFTEKDNESVINSHQVAAEDSDQVVPNGQWTYAGFTIESTAQYQTEINLYKNGSLARSVTIDDQYADQLLAQTYIGCSQYLENDAMTNKDFFKGYMYKIFIRKEVLDGSTLGEEATLDTGNLPDNNVTCSATEYFDGEYC